MKFNKGMSLVVVAALVTVSVLVGLKSEFSAMTHAADPDATPSNLPHAHGRSFATLDDYLAFRKEGGTRDLPFYELQPDGRYRYVTGRGASGDPQIFTREQLMEKFGFTR